jgi:hypothetical protein
MPANRDSLMWLCACCALIETSWLDADEQPVCSLCREVSCPRPCRVRKLLHEGKLSDVVADILRPGAH